MRGVGGGGGSRECGREVKHTHLHLQLKPSPCHIIPGLTPSMFVDAKKSDLPTLGSCV